MEERAERTRKQKKTEEAVGEDLDAEPEEDKEVELGSPEDVGNVNEAAIGAEGAEAEDLKFMQRVRALRRLKPKQKRVRIFDNSPVFHTATNQMFADRAV